MGFTDPDGLGPLELQEDLADERATGFVFERFGQQRRIAAAELQRDRMLDELLRVTQLQ